MSVIFEEGVRDGFVPKAENDQSILWLFPTEKRTFWEKVLKEARGIMEIRIRCGMPVILVTRDGEFFVSKEGEIVRGDRNLFLARLGDMEEMVRRICQYSPYAYENELSNGFLTMPGGHRIGVAGQAVIDENGRVKTIKHIHSMNVRIAHEIRGAGDGVLDFLYGKQGETLKNTLIISPPGSGKTTILRDLVRQVSDGGGRRKGVTVGVVDERMELGGSFNGAIQNYLGKRTDVLDGCPKKAGISLLVRSMAPRVIAVDELGGEEDFLALTEAIASGCSVLATMHGKDLKDVFFKCSRMDRAGLRLFELFVIMDRLSGTPRVVRIYEKEEAYASFDGWNHDSNGNIGHGDMVQAKDVYKD